MHDVAAGLVGWGCDCDTPPARRFAAARSSLDIAANADGDQCWVIRGWRQQQQRLKNDDNERPAAHDDGRLHRWRL